MNGLFWQLLIPAVLTFGLIAWGTDRTCRAVQRRWQRRQMRKEMERLIVASLQRSEAIIASIQYELAEELAVATRRKQLDSLATSQDRRERRIVH